MNKLDYTHLDDYVAIVTKELKPFQKAYLDHARDNPRCILDSWMGTGKTLMGLTATLLQRPEKVLIACSKNALWTWQKELAKWYPEYSADKFYNVISGSPSRREQLWTKDAVFYVCTYSVLRNDIEQAQAHGFDVFILDEFHRSGLRQHTVSKKRKSDPITGKPIKTPTGFGLIKMLKGIPSIIPISGTVISKGPQDAWPTLNILNSRIFSSYWQFVHQFCIVIDTPFGKSIEGAQNTKKLRELARPYWYIIPKEIADKELPPLTKQLVPVEMSAKQRKLYEHFEKEMYVELSDGGIMTASTTLSVGTRLRQLLVCPKIIDPECNDCGIGIETVVDMAQDHEDSHIVIFTPYRQAVTYFKEYVKKHLSQDVFHIWGGLEPEELRDRVNAWKQTRGVIICTVLFSQSFELETSQACYFIGCEWDQNDNDQASARLRRLISPGPINAYYMQHKGTIEERVLEILNDKRRTCKVTTQDFKDILKDMEAKYGGTQTEIDI